MHSSLTLWLEHPITKIYRNGLVKHRLSKVDELLNMGTLTPERLGELAEIKGQIRSLDIMLDLGMLDVLLEDEVTE